MRLTTPYAVLAGFALVALAVASLPLTNKLVPEAQAQSSPVKVTICDESGWRCASTSGTGSNVGVKVYAQ